MRFPMRISSAFTLMVLFGAGFLSGQDSGGDRRNPGLGPLAAKPWVVKVSPLEMPANPAVGDEYTISTTVSTTSEDLQTVNFRLMIPAGLQVLAPGQEQILILEPNTSQVVRWRVKRVGDQIENVFVSQTAVLQGRAFLAARALDPGGAKSLPPLPDVLTKPWHGTWRNQQGMEYDATLTLRVNADKSVSGRIDWKLTKSARADLQPKIGLTGVEFVWGVYDATTRGVFLEGYRRDDPNGLLGLDTYNLILAKDNATLAGKTLTHRRTWEGQIQLTPKWKDDKDGNKKGT